MRVGVQFTGTIPAGQTDRWFTFNWPQEWHVVWYVVPVSPPVVDHKSTGMSRLSEWMVSSPTGLASEI